MRPSLEEFEKRIGVATASDTDLDRVILRTFGHEAEDAIPRYTPSVYSCIDMVWSAFPGWHWQIGCRPLGIMPFDTMSKPDGHHQLFFFLHRGDSTDFPVGTAAVRREGHGGVNVAIAIVLMGVRDGQIGGDSKRRA